MALGPFLSEQIPDSDFEAMVSLLCRNPDMVVGRASFDTVCAYLLGFDSARSNGPLLGFQPWLVMRVNGWNNMAWPGLVERIIPPVQPDPDTLRAEHRRIEALGNVLREFLTYRRENGLTKLFSDYATWLRRRSWYTGPLRDERHKAGKAKKRPPRPRRSDPERS
jgi:hypothetical protein